jgi:tRNA uracil 4-sulfurtransferase
MMTKKILIRFGDLMLKGKNIKTFKKRIFEHISFKLKQFDIDYFMEHDRLYIVYFEKDEAQITSKLSRIQGIASYSIVYESSLDMDDIVVQSVRLIQDEISDEKPIRFKIETKRANKHFPLTSTQTTQTLAPRIIALAKRPLVIDVHHPEEILTIEIRNEATYMFLKKHQGIGGFPVHSGDHALMMISGGIDSPVAAYLALRQGVQIDLIHFESTPMTSLESAQKVIDLAKVIAEYTRFETIVCHMIPLIDIHKGIMEMVPKAYHITVMRRMMYKISEKIAIKGGMHGLINGESLGQVASQTLQSLRAVEVVTKLPIIRPLVTCNKNEIVQIAKMIKTYDISIRPFEDCCSIYVPSHPATKPRDYIAERYEGLLDFDALIEIAIQNVNTIFITPKSDLVLTNHGFTVTDAYHNYLNSKEN